MGLKEAYGEEEWAFICKHGLSLNDREQRESFKQMIIDKKTANPNYSIFTDFPKIEERSAKQRIADQYAGAILSVLKASGINGVKSAKEEPRNAELTAFGEEIGKLIELGAHNEKPRNL